VQGSVDEERLLEYQNRVAAWIGNQGVFFQLRYAGIVGNYSILRHCWNLAIKLLIVLAVAAGIGYFLLTRHFASETYSDKIEAEISGALGAAEIDASGFSRSRGRGSFRNVELVGSDDSFFTEAKIELLSGPFKYSEGVTESWKPKEIRIREASFQLKAGGDAEEMERSFASIIETFEGNSLESVDIHHLDIEWGYSTLTYGTITDTAFKADLVDGEWLISLTGGVLTQNWLKNFELVSGELTCGPNGLKVDSLLLKMGKGVLDISGEISGTLAMPEFNLSGKFRSLPIEKMVILTGVRLRDALSGSISGDLQITGSTNRTIQTSGNVLLKGDDFITLREQWDILKMLSVIDLNNSYRRIDFDSGAFSFSTGDGGLKIADLVLSAGDLMKLEGDLETRLPSQKEAADSLGIKLTEGFGEGVNDDVTDISSAASLEEERLSLKRAAGIGKVSDYDIDLLEGEGGGPRGKGARLSGKELNEKRLRIAMSVHRVSGSLRIGVGENTFSEYPMLGKIYPTDDESWRWVPLDFDTTFSKISEDQAEKLKLESRVRATTPSE